MNCPYCNNVLPEGAYNCPYCGTAVYAAPPAQPAQPTFTEADIPQQYRLMGPWAYFGYSLLFSIPFVGFILLIVFSCNSSNLNRRNYARSYWCSLIILAVFVAILLIMAASAGGLAALLSEF